MCILVNSHRYTFSMTSLARWTGLATLLTADTAPQANVRPSITKASISTSPFRFNTEPLPEFTQIQIWPCFSRLDLDHQTGECLNREVFALSRDHTFESWWCHSHLQLWVLECCWCSPCVRSLSINQCYTSQWCASMSLCMRKRAKITFLRGCYVSKMQHAQQTKKMH